MTKRRMVMAGTILLVSLVSLPLWANHVAVDNVSLTDQNTTDHYTHIKFDISWENSWRVSTGPRNWDAAWVFAKWKLHSGTDWHTAPCILQDILPPPAQPLVQPLTVKESSYTEVKTALAPTTGVT